jgi:steroid delta-isomerase-like uncharacterized protein
MAGRRPEKSNTKGVQMKFAVRISLAALATIVCACSPATPAASDSGATKAAVSNSSGEANVATLTAYVDAWNRRDTVAMDSLLGPGGIHDDLAWGFHGVGSAQVNGFMRDVLKTQPDYKWTVVSTFADGQHVAAEWTWKGTYSGPSPTGVLKNVPTSGRGAAIVEIENGKIKQFTDYYDAASFFPKDSTRK